MLAEKGAKRSWIDLGGDRETPRMLTGVDALSGGDRWVVEGGCTLGIRYPEGAGRGVGIDGVGVVILVGPILVGRQDCHIGAGSHCICLTNLEKLVRSTSYT
jgi:hypothetical protein